MQEIKSIIESLLFVAEEPLAVDKLRTILETAETKEIHDTLKLLSEEYDQRGGGFMLRQVAGGWQIRSRPEYNEWIKRMLQPSPQRLSRAALETLAVIAYKQPIIRADIEHIRGVDCGGVLRQLMERKIIRVLGRKEIAGRPLIYATTKLFLEMFDLKDLNDLPSPKEIAELGNALIDSQQEPSPDGPAPSRQDAPPDQAVEPEDAANSLTPEAETEPLAQSFPPTRNSEAPPETGTSLHGQDPAEPEPLEMEAAAQDLEAETEPPAQSSPPAPGSEAPPEAGTPLPGQDPAEPEPLELAADPRSAEAVTPEDIYEEPDAGFEDTVDAPLEEIALPADDAADMPAPYSEDGDEAHLQENLDDNDDFDDETF